MKPAEAEKFKMEKLALANKYGGGGDRGGLDGWREDGKCWVNRGY